MEGRVEGPLGGILRRGRERFNARFAAARAMKGTIDPAEFAEHLRGPLDRVVAAVAAASPDRAETAAEALYDLSLDLFTHDLLGSRSRCPAIAEAWELLLPDVARLLAENPRGVAASVLNALLNLHQESQPVADSWMNELLKVSPYCSGAADLLGAGQVLAWRCGLAHYRDSALRIWACLPDELKRITLGATPEEDLASLGRNLFADPWHAPEKNNDARKLKVAALCGGFRGFGGPFIHPPLVTASGGMLLAFDTKGCFRLHADFFGCTLTRFAGMPPASAVRVCGRAVFTAEGRVTFRTASAMMPRLRGFSSCACNETTLAVTLPHSHYVHVVAPVAEEAQ